MMQFVVHLRCTVLLVLGVGKCYEKAMIHEIQPVWIKRILESTC